MLISVVDILVRLRVLAPLRANCWWEYKISPVLATMYATAALTGVSVVSVWPAVVFAAAALAVCATYVSVLNDLTDFHEDKASGKLNRWRSARSVGPALLLGACLAAGCGFLFLWRNHPLVFSAYLMSWMAFTLYSARPFRLKVRGIWGVLADASGAHLFPALFAVFLVAASGNHANGKWVIAVAVWSFAAGIRGILWHQLEDWVHDEKIALPTFVFLHGRKAARQLGWCAALLEWAGFAAMLWLTQNAFAAILLVSYGLFVWLRGRVLGTQVRMVEPAAGARMAMSEYYIVLYPAAYLLSASWQQHSVLWLLMAHAMLFARHFLRMARDLIAMLTLSAVASRTATISR